MPRIIISKVASEMLAAYAVDNDMVLTDHKELPDGRVEIEVDADVLAAFSVIDKDLDKAITRACSDILRGRRA